MKINRNVILLISLVFFLLFFTGCSVEGHEMTTPTDFWNTHGFWFLFFMNIFPRITMLVATPFPIGFWGWCGWLVYPRIYAAIIATTLYWETNALLCVITWIIALSTTGGSNGVTISKVKKR